MLDPDDPRHGTRNGYDNLRCKCQPCRDAWARWHLAYMKRHPEQYAKGRRRARERYDSTGEKGERRRGPRAAAAQRRRDTAARQRRRAELRTLIRDLHAAGMGYAHIADYLNEKKVPALRPDGKAWNKGTIWHIINKEDE